MVETVKYEVNRKIGRVEIRRYPKIVVAKVENSEADAFDLLYKFITGNNRQKTKVKMTTPVVSQQISYDFTRSFRHRLYGFCDASRIHY